MDTQNALQVIRELSNANGASGFEDDVLKVLRKNGDGLGKISEDSLRNLYLRGAENTGKRPVIQLDAHSDEVSFMVQAVKPNGTLVFIPLGGWVPNNVPAHKARVRNAEGKYIPGIVASKPPHFMSEAEKNAPASLSGMVIDIGATSREEAISDFKIRIGEPVVPDVDFEYVAEKDLMIGKAFDCRLGCAAILETMKELKDKRLNVDVVGGFAVQEEVGLRGAGVTCNTIHPDIAIVFEGCPADDTFSEEYLTQTAIKKGPMLRHIDARMITNPRYQRYALDLGEKLGIPVQQSVRTGGSTNGAPIHLSNAGVPVIVIGLPVRYIHTHYGIASFSDFQNAVKLACAVIESLDADRIKSF
nr:M42 family peptidase [uncultured Caproiciproducens sp.]